MRGESGGHRRGRTTSMNTIEHVFACQQRDRVVDDALRRGLPVAEAERRLRGQRGTLAALRRLSQPIANAYLVNVAIRTAAGNVHYVRPASAYQQALTAGWRFVRRRAHAGAELRWFWYRQGDGICGDGRRLREDAAHEALTWDLTRPPAAAVAAAGDDPRVVRIVWYPSGRWGWRNGRGEMRAFRRLPSGAWGMAARETVDRRRLGPDGKGWVCFSARGGVLARGAE